MGIVRVKQRWLTTSDQQDTLCTHLQTNASIKNGFSYLCYGTCHEKAGRNNTNYGSKGKDGLYDFGEELVGCHTQENGSKDNLSLRRIVLFISKFRVRYLNESETIRQLNTTPLYRVSPSARYHLSIIPYTYTSHLNS